MAGGRLWGRHCFMGERMELIPGTNDRPPVKKVLMKCDIVHLDSCSVSCFVALTRGPYQCYSFAFTCLIAF